jgi:hypothetical protein
MYTRAQQGLTIVLLCSFLISCGGISPANDNSINSQAEDAYCGTNYPTTDPITLTGQANYQYRALNCDASDCTTLSAGVSTRGIPHAEVVVRDANGTIVQCGKTNGTGAISISISKVVGSYTVSVNSRANHSLLKTSVLADISSNNYYTLTTSFSILSGTNAVNVNTFTASASGPEVKGAAFHILYNIWTANEFIRNSIGNPAFVTDKVTAYWKAGFNPGTYVGTSSPLSFYIKGSRQLFILGGSNGNFTTVDFDHFDDSVILHEFAHFLEDVYSVSDSQGGSHNGNFLIDPRLAWSEGFANYFQGAVVRQLGGANDTTRGRFYIDILNGTDPGIKFNLGANGQSTPYDQVAHDGEGIFREVSIARTLWKTTAPNGATSNPAAGEVPFSAVWTAFSSTTDGIKSATKYFRNSGLFNSLLDLIINTSHGARVGAWNNIIANEKQNIDTRDYADPVNAVALGTCTKYPLDLFPVTDKLYGFFGEKKSDPLFSNDFYIFNYAGGGGSISIDYTNNVVLSSNGSRIDLDLYLYRQGYVYQEDELEAFGQTTGGVVAKSDRVNQVFENGNETINLASVGAGVYLINVKANTYNKINASLTPGKASYTLKFTQGATTWDLCPEN